MILESENLFLLKIGFMKFLFYFFFYSSLLFSQNQSVLNDKEYFKFQEKFRNYLSENIDSAQFYVNKIKSSNKFLHKAYALGAESYLNQLNGDSVKSIVNYNKALEYLNFTKPSIEKTKNAAYIYNFGGLSDWKRGNLKNALNQYLLGEKLSLGVNDIIQVVKFDSNIASIYSDIGNYTLAVKTAKTANNTLDKNAFLYDKNAFDRIKNSINYKLGNFYLNHFFANKKDKTILDSAQYFFKQSIIYSKNNEINNFNAKMNLGSVYKYKKDFVNSEKMYYELLKNFKNISSENILYLNLNLGELYFEKNKLEESFVCFKKADSIRLHNKLNSAVFFTSNYYLAKIYHIKGDNKNAYLNSNLYLENFKESEAKLGSQVQAINYQTIKKELSKEMLIIRNQSKEKVYFKNFIIVVIFFLFVFVIVFLIWKINQRKKTNDNLNFLIKEFSEQIEKNKLQPLVQIIPKDLVLEKKYLSIDEEKENDIVDKLIALEKKLFYLNQDFTQQMVAKKIKTNTTYLSFVVNKRFRKSFGEYANELKINYAISEMISNTTFRKYSTQAIAESVGFKNATSFTRSFSKRTGISPVRFAEKLNSN